MNSNLKDVYNNSNDNLNKIKSLLQDCENSENFILEELDNDKEKLIKINQNIEKVIDETNISKKILSKFENRETKRKVFIGIGLGFATIGALIAGILFVKKNK